MGGKTKQTARTKNNARPSNSLRSAELFGAQLPAFTGFAMCDVPVLPGFQTPSTTAAISPDGAQLDIDLDVNLDTNYQLVLRKMTKKDPVTKTKALQEFIELCNASEVDAVVAVLPFWPRLYANLATDFERRVREASQEAQAAVALKCGKQIAPFLRQLAPAWITSQFDTYAPAASVATQSFQRSFKAAKQQEVFTYCQAEILDYVTRNVTVLTAAALQLTPNRGYTIEDYEAKYERIVTGCLKAYAQYLSRLSAAQLTEATDRNLAIIGHSKFWSHYKSKATSIRAGWFEALAALLQHAPQYLEAHGPEAVTAAMQTLDESEPLVLPHLWSAVLLVTQTVPDWTRHVKIEKVVLPKLWRVLKTGGAGSAACTHSHLLPLLSKLNAGAVGDEHMPGFYASFFEHMHTGLLARVSHRSRSDTVAICAAYFECLRFVLVQLQSAEQQWLPCGSAESLAFSERLVDEHLIAVIAWTMSADVTGTKSVYTTIGSLIAYWTQHAETSALYAHVLAHFWPALQAALELALNVDEPRIGTVLRLQLSLLHELRAGQLHTTRTRSSGARVQFIAPVKSTDAVVDSAAGHQNAAAAATDAANAAIVPPAVKRVECDELALRLCLVYMRKATEKLLPVFVDSVEDVLKTFGSLAFFTRLADGGKLFKLYDKFSVWLLIAQLRRENVIDILLRLYAHLDEADQRLLLSKLLKFPNERVQSWLIARLLSHPLCSDESVPALLAQPSVRQILFASADRIVAGETTENVDFLHKCFFQTENGRILIDALTCRGIAERLVAALSDADAQSRSGVLDSCASFLAQIMPVICCDSAQIDLQRLLFVAFFEFSVWHEVGEHLTQDTLWEITTSWQDALSSGDIELSDEMLAQCAAIVHRKLAADEPVTLSNIENTAEMVAKLIVCSLEQLHRNLNETERDVIQRTDQMLDRMFDSHTKEHRSRQSYVEHACLYASAISAELAVPDLGSRLGTTEDVQVEATFDTFMKLASFRFNVIFRMTCAVKQQRRRVAVKKAEEEEGEETDEELEADEDDEYTEDYCDSSDQLLKISTDRIFEEIIGGIYVASMAENLLSRFVKWSANTELYMVHHTERVPQYLRNVCGEQVAKIQTRLFAEAKKRGLLWSNAVLWLCNVTPFDDAENGMTVLRELDELAVGEHANKTVYVNLLQTFAANSAPRILPIERNLFVGDLDANLLVKCTTLRCLIENYSRSEANDSGDRLIMETCKDLLSQLYGSYMSERGYFLYNEDLSNTAPEHVIEMAEIANFYTAVLRAYPHRLEANDWDLIRIAVSSWVLSVSKSSEHTLRSAKVAAFTAAVYRLFAAFHSFIAPQAQRSSTHLLETVITEWNDLFARDVNQILLKCYLKFVARQRDAQLTDMLFVDTISSYVAQLDVRHVLAQRRIDSSTSLDELLDTALINLAHKSHRVRTAFAGLLRRLAVGLVAIDAELLRQRQTADDSRVDVSPAAVANRCSSTWHVLHKFGATLRAHEAHMAEYSDEFSFKSNELDKLREVPAAVAMPFLLLWSAVLDIVAGCNANAELRIIYSAYLTTGGNGQSHLHRLVVALFRLMPVELLRNQDAKPIGQAFFAPLDVEQLHAEQAPVPRFACHTYARALRQLPAAVRKWWNDAPVSQKTLVDKLTTAFVSGQLCGDELRALLEKRGGGGGAAAGSENMQLTVHTSTREVIATYSIDEARMELVLTLPVNHPLGAVRVESGKQIGGRVQARTLVMQLTLFLTHQNGSLADGLALWKNNLDNKFEGVAECYVCYSVIHQDTFQLPRLSCRKCKNKFHAPCLYKWFSSSNKSTCPVCRSVF